MNHRFRRLLHVSALSFVMLMVSSCGSLGKIVDAPKVSLSDVQLVSAGLLEQRYRLTLRVQNPNSVGIPISGIDYAVKLAGVDFASGVTPNSFTLPANGEDLVNIDVSTNLLESARQIYNVIKQGPDSLDYQLSGNVKVNLPFVKSLPFSRSGKVDLNR